MSHHTLYKEVGHGLAETRNQPASVPVAGGSKDLLLTRSVQDSQLNRRQHPKASNVPIAEKRANNADRAREGSGKERS
jgi:hypothetical protein